MVIEVVYDLSHYPGVGTPIIQHVYISTYGYVLLTIN